MVGMMAELAKQQAWQAARVEQTAQVDEALVRLGRGGAGQRLWLGEVLEAMAVRGAHHALGFSSLGAYARERCGRSERWVNDTRTLARQLAYRRRRRRSFSSRCSSPASTMR